MGRHRELNYEEIQRFIFKHYTNANPPMKQKEIAKIFHTHESVISKIVTENNMQRKYNFRRSKREDIVESLKNGKGVVQVAKELGVSDGYVSSIKTKFFKIAPNPEERKRRKKLGCVDCLHYKDCMFLDCPFE